MVVMDADSFMIGADVVRMVALMEKHPRVGLLQTAPRLINGESLYGRIQQFAFRFYGDLFTAGLNLWQGPDGNYWGHNAVIRLTPFIDYCALPDLPGREPFGGKILSHDFVEAALMRRVDWEVWLLWDVGGTYEEGPQSLIDNAKRDRRWLQGNLQHTWLLFAAGLRQMSRLHLFLGIMGYLASTLWFLFLVVSTVVQINIKLMGLSLVPGESNIPPFMHLTVAEQGQLLFGATLVLLFLPKLLAFLQCILRPERLRSFGGLPSVVAGILVETVYSALTAPVVMLFHTQFFVWLLLGKKVEWVTQQRAAVGTTWKEAIHTHGNQTLLALVWLAVAFFFNPIHALWLLPVMGPALIAIPLSVWSSRPGPGLALKSLRILATPEEIRPPEEYVEMAQRMENEETVLSGRFERDAQREGITRSIVDPYVNAVHVSLMERESEDVPISAQGREICDRVMAEGPMAVDEASMRMIASNPEIMVELHRKIWVTPFAELSPWWQHAIERYRRTV
jgi:membrane glycosyltransferase